MSTFAEICELASIDLQDPDHVTWPIEELLKHAFAAVQLAFQLAPHLFFGQFNATPPTRFALSDPSPLSPQYDRAIADFIIARAHLKDDEDARDAEAMPFIQLFRAQIGA